MIPASHVLVIQTRANTAVPAGGELAATLTLEQRPNQRFAIRRIRATAQTGEAIDAQPIGTMLPTSPSSEAAGNTTPTLDGIAVALEVAGNKLQNAPYSLGAYGPGGALMFEPAAIDYLASGSDLLATFTNNNSKSVRNIKLELFGAWVLL
jgi:hypothetical protein